MRRPLVLSAVLALGLGGVWIRGAQQAAPQPAAINPANFTGTVTQRSATDIRTLRYHFDPGARTNWHSHEGGQLILVEEGRIRVQERGQRIKEFGPRESFHTAPGVTHWHGALPGEGLTQVALSFGNTTWIEKVSDEEYSHGTKR
jgi:quercetin dioxygenase-like cupin family protein